ncbi:MAG: glycosyltransferase family 4 protein [Planctomycetes bacterium]|nr:glycosyltransferase family 4 protein [Planctomycetota bacterium]
MKILHFHDSPHIHGGATQYLKQVLVALEAAGHENHLFSLGPSVNFPGIAEHHRFSYEWPKSPLKRRKDFYMVHWPLADKLNSVIDLSSPDIIHFHNCANFRETVFSTILNRELKSVMTIHDFSMNFKSSPQCKSGSAKALLANALNRFPHQRASEKVRQAVDLFLCPTQAILDGLRLPSSKSVVHRLPIDNANSSEMPTDMLRMFFAGTLFNSKGVDLLIEALAICGSELPDFKLEIAGSGDQQQSLENLVAAKQLQSKVAFLGQLDGKQMDMAYRRANLQVLPSRVPENSPLTVLEAGARGRASIASHAGGVPELIDRSRGWTFASENSADLANKLSSIANNLASLSEKGEEMRKWVRAEFDPVAHWQKLENHYASLIS